MARIVLSHSSSDRELTDQIARFLEADGHEVWWDYDLVSGDSFRTVIDEKLDAADVVIVIWTPASVRAKWVIAEADHAERLDKLLPLKTETVQDWQIPKPFGTLHTTTITNKVAILGALEHIANSDNRDRERGKQPLAKADDSAARTTEASAETQIATYLIALLALIVFGSTLAAYWSRTDAEYDTFKAAVLLTLGTTLTIGVVPLCFALCRHTSNAIYSTILTFTTSSIGTFVWLMFGSLLAYLGDFRNYLITVSASVIVIAVYASLATFQLRGASWVFPAARLLAVVQILALTAHIALQIDWAMSDNDWYTSHSLAFLHLLYMATHVSGVVIAAAFLVASSRYAAKTMRA